MNSEAQRFSELWDSFAASLRVRLEKEREKQPLSYSVCTLVLNDEKLDWNTDDNPCGRWLEELRKTEPEKADLILSIIMDDVKFSEPEKSNALTLADILGYGIIPFVLAMLGMLECIFLKASFVTTLITEIVIEVLAVLVYIFAPFGKKTSKTAIEKYVSQLDKFKGVIADILNRTPGAF